MEIYFVRHGQTIWNVEKRFQGLSDSPLTELGITQAKLLGKKLKDIKFDKFYSTSLKRANDTANYIKGDRDQEIEIFDDEIEFTGDKMYEYRFVTLYLPLNDKNFSKYLNREYTLEQAITNNILEVLKGLGIWLEKENKIYVSADLQITSRDLKNVNMIAFIGNFYTNIKFPDYFSLGKRKSLGYGTFVKVTK